MRKIIVGAFMSIDGVMQAPGGPEEDPSGGFAHGGWVAGHWDEAIGASIDALFGEPFDLLLGRRTYDIFAAHWPYVEKDPSGAGYDEGSAKIGETFDRITKYVATHRPQSLGWQNSQGLGTDIVATLRELKKGDGPRLLTQGSTVLLHTLLEYDLVDELNLIVLPLMLGKGKRLFGEASAPAAFELVRSSTSAKGTVFATYRRAGDIQTASFAMENPTDQELERRKTLT